MGCFFLFFPPAQDPSLRSQFAAQLACNRAAALSKLKRHADAVAARTHAHPPAPTHSLSLIIACFVGRCYVGGIG